jgi:hypothetical protein
MTKGPRRLRVFVGFKIESTYHTEHQIKSLMDSLAARLKAEGIVLSVEYGKFPAGVILWDSVRDSIRHSEVAIFDISENNPNVMIEVGLAIGYAKRVLLLKSSESAAHHPKPSDLPHIYVSYDSEKGIQDSSTVDELERAITNFLRSPPDPDHYFKGVWGFDEFDEVQVVCSELEDPAKLQHPEPWEFIYLSKYGDLDALFEAESTIHELYPNVHVGHGTGTEMLRNRGRDQFAGNIVLVGGPDYNALTQFFEKFSPVEYLPAGQDNNISIRLKDGGLTLTPSRSEAGPEHVVDYGFFVNRLNPYNPDKRLVMVGGCHTYGVYGAVKAFSYSRRGGDPVAHRNCRDVVDRLGPDAEFYAVFEVHGVGSSIPTPKLDHSRLWPL